MNTKVFESHSKRAAVAAVSLFAIFSAAPTFAQPLSGGASGEGAIQGGSGEPGGGVGIPGSLQNGTSAWGIGEDDTFSARPSHAAMRGAQLGDARAYYVSPRLTHN